VTELKLFPNGNTMDASQGWQTAYMDIRMRTISARKVMGVRRSAHLKIACQDQAINATEHLAGRNCASRPFTMLE
jgi:hypothetical protein